MNKIDDLFNELDTLLNQKGFEHSEGLFVKLERIINGEKYQGNFDTDYNRLARAKEILKELKGGEF